MSSVEENKLPDGWKNVRLDSIGLFIRGVSYKKHQLLNEYVDGCITILRANNIQNGLYLNDFQYLPNGFVKEDKITKDGDILLAMSSGSKNLVGKNTKLPKLSNFSFGAFCSIYRLNDTNQSNYVSLFFQSPYYDSIISNLFRGAGINNLRSSDLDSVVIPLPPLEEQKHIVAKIDTLFAKIDKAISLTEESLKQAENLLPSVLKEVFEKGKADGWEEKKWDEVLEIKNGKSQKEFLVDDGGYPIYGSGGLMNGRVSKFLCPKNTTIVGRKGTIDKPKYIEEDFWNVDTAFGLCSKTGLNPRFLYYFCLIFNFRSLNKSTTLPSLTKRDLLQIRMPITTSENQMKVVRIADDILLKSQKTQSKLEEQLAYLKQLKSSILSKAFKGEL